MDSRTAVVQAWISRFRHDPASPSYIANPWRVAAISVGVVGLFISAVCLLSSSQAGPPPSYLSTARRILQSDLTLDLHAPLPRQIPKVGLTESGHDRLLAVAAQVRSVRLRNGDDRMRAEWAEAPALARHTVSGGIPVWSYHGSMVVGAERPVGEKAAPSSSRLAGQLIAIDFEVADLGNGVYAISDVSIPR